MSQVESTLPLSEEDKIKVITLARRTLWIAYVWNDHNFDDAHKEAQATCKALGINSLEEAKVFLEKMTGR